ncbi:ATP-binding cassette domain-containing protein [Rhizobium sp.]|uniref:ABC transporter ATP-binding protein n=1 Tax=Rhizobium sp. TaxID=391 RepID=UPI000E939C63|nr:ABC transporter ATP-binding protein [Rhizobium sp.]
MTFSATSTAAEAVVVFNQVSKRFAVNGQDFTALQDISLKLREGEFTAIVGASGCGKSTLLRLLVGLDREFDGSITVDGRPLAGIGADRGIVFQEHRLFPWLSVQQNIALGLANDNGSAATHARLVQEHIELVGLKGFEQALPHQLSGGMAQRVAFAAARAGGARIVIADEPTKGLDIARRDEVIDLLMREVRAGGTVLTITHDLELARRMGGDLAVMLEGRIIETGAAEDVLSNPAHGYTKRLIAADPTHWADPAQPLSASSSASKPVLVASGLGKTRGGKPLFSHIDLSVQPGEIVGVTGPSGSGKSSLGDILLGLLAPDAGRVSRAEGVSRHRYQKIYQDPPSAFPPRATIRRTLVDLVALHGLKASAILPLMHRLRLNPSLLDRRPGEVSGGELQRFALLRVLLLDPVFLFADEPTSRLDPITQQETIALLVELAREKGCALLIVSHDTALIEKTCDRTIAIGTQTLTEAA